MRIKTILNRVQKFKSFVYGTVSWVGGALIPTLEVEKQPRSNSQPECSGCGQRRSGYDRMPKRRFEFIPMWGHKVYFVYAPRRVACPACGIRVERMPWVSGKHRLTEAYAWFLSGWEKRLSWNHVFCSVERAVSWGREHQDLSGVEVLVQIEAAGLTARKSQIVDAALVPVPRQRNSRDENARIKKGEQPEDWSQNKRRQKDVQARWAKKRGKTHYGYKNHIIVDRQHKVIRSYAVSSAEVHDSKVFEVLLDEQNSSADVRADSAYRSAEREAELREAGYRSHVHRKGKRAQPLNARAQEANRKRSTVWARVEHVFAQQANRLVRTIGRE